MKEEYCSIFNECFPQFHMTKKRFDELLENDGNVYFEHSEMGEVVAFAIVNSFAIRLICVIPAKQKAGIGTKLLADIEDYIKSKGYEKVITGGVSSHLFIGAVSDSWYFFEKAGYRQAGGCDEMLLHLKDFCREKYKLHGSDIAQYGWYEGSIEELHAAVASVDESWVQYFTDPKKIYAARVGDQIASFCIVDKDCNNYLTDAYGRIGMPGCVGTVPAYRNKGIALEMIANVTEYLKEQELDVSFIYFTGVADWYKKIGYQTFLTEIFGVKCVLQGNLRLVKLSREYKRHLSEMMEEWLSVEQKFSPYAIRKNDYRDFDYYLEHLEVKKAVDNLVPDSTYFCLDTDRDIFVGAVNIRHFLGPNNCHTGGHIGDGIRPSERRKGYATAMIGLALEKCRELGMNKVLMTCDKDNIGSAKSIINNGGVFEREIIEDGEVEQRYWITLNEEIVETERLVLKRRMPSDAKEAFEAWGQDERNLTYMIGGVIPSLEEQLMKFDNADPNSKTRYIMIARSKEDNHAVGLIALNGETKREGYEISWLVRFEDHNKGYCTEMAKAMMRYLRETIGGTSFWAECADENIASCKVMTKLGMTPVEKSAYSKRDGSRTFASTVYRVG